MKKISLLRHWRRLVIAVVALAGPTLLSSCVTTDDYYDRDDWEDELEEEYEDRRENYGDWRERERDRQEEYRDRMEDYYD